MQFVAKVRDPGGEADSSLKALWRLEEARGDVEGVEMALVMTSDARGSMWSSWCPETCGERQGKQA